MFFGFLPDASEIWRRTRLHITRHTEHGTRHTSHITRHTSHVTRHTSHVTRHAGSSRVGVMRRSASGGGQAPSNKSPPAPAAPPKAFRIVCARDRATKRFSVPPACSFEQFRTACCNSHVRRWAWGVGCGTGDGFLVVMVMLHQQRLHLKLTLKELKIFITIS